MRYDLITFGSATLDVFLTSDEFKLSRNFFGKTAICQVFGEKIETNLEAVSSGGGGTNCAVGASRLGLKTAVAARIGDDVFSQKVIKDLENDKVSQEFLIKGKNEKTDFSVVLVSKEGQRTILVSRGKTTLTEQDLDFDKLFSSWFHISSLEGNIELAEKILIHAKKNNIKTSWNPGKREIGNVPILRKFLKNVDVLVLNQQETESLLGKRSLWSKSYDLECGYLVVTQGNKGAFLVDVKNRQIKKFKAYKTKAVEETGAGDAFCSGLVSALIYKFNINEAMRWGLANGASVVSAFGAKTALLGKKGIIGKL